VQQTGGPQYKALVEEPACTLAGFHLELGLDLLVIDVRCCFWGVFVYNIACGVSVQSTVSVGYLFENSFWGMCSEHSAASLEYYGVLVSGILFLFCCCCCSI